MAYTTIDDPSAHFQVKAYTGTGGTDEAFTNDGNSDLQPDLIWIKPRNFADNHILTDSTRGVDSQLYSNLNYADDSFTIGVESFDSDGFSLNSWNNVNDINDTFVAWQWKANGGSRTTFSEVGDNPAGGYQANTTAGFSIIDYTGTGATGTIAHGLGAKPDFWVIKNRGGGGIWSWYVYHGSNTSAPETDSLYLTNGDATLDSATRWNDTAPTSSVFTLGDNGGVNANDNTYICYLFTSIQGYSKFGSYTGNGDADGPFVYTGFRPAFFMVKNTSTGNTEWRLYDNKRSAYNEAERILYPSTNGAEVGTGHPVDLDSNGVKIRGTWTEVNTDGDTYIYMAFAENPFVTSTGIPATAR